MQAEATAARRRSTDGRAHHQDSIGNIEGAYYMPSDVLSPDDWAEFDNVYQAHCPRIVISDVTRDVSGGIISLRDRD
jgi:uncharacterized protein (DUF2236 family)